MSKFSFAHLLGMGKAAKVYRAEDDEDERDAVEDDPDAEDDDKPSQDGKKSKKANEDETDAEDDDPDAEDDDPDAEDDEDDPAAEEEDENKDVKKGRKAERERCAAIFGSKHAAGRPDLAATLAFTTRLTAKEAIRVMRANGQSVSMTQMGATSPKRKTLQERMANIKQPKIGANGGNSDGGSAADKMMSLYNRATGSNK